MKVKIIDTFVTSWYSIGNIYDVDSDKVNHHMGEAYKLSNKSTGRVIVCSNCEVVSLKCLYPTLSKNYISK